MNKDILLPIAIAVGGLSVGAGVGYIVASKRLEKRYAKLAQTEINSVKETYRLLRKDPPYDNPRTALQAYNERIDELDYWTENGVPEEEPAIFNNLVQDKQVESVINQATAELRLSDVSFDSSDTIHLEKSPSEPTAIVNIFDADDKAPLHVPDRTADKFIIGVDEYMQGGLDEQRTLMYYEGDGVLTDEGDERVDVVDLVGHDNLKFGVMSGHSSTVYVRNTVYEVDMEIVRNEGSYSQEVLGIVPSTVKSPVPKVQARRRESPDG